MLCSSHDAWSVAVRLYFWSRLWHCKNSNIWVIQSGRFDAGRFLRINISIHLCGNQTPAVCLHTRPVLCEFFFQTLVGGLHKQFRNRGHDCLCQFKKKNPPILLHYFSFWKSPCMTKSGSTVLNFHLLIRDTVSGSYVIGRDIAPQSICRHVPEVPPFTPTI